MEQTYKRRILVHREADGIAVDLEDNFHRFGVRLALVDHTIREVEGIARRVPWTTCPGALAALQDLKGHDLRARFEIDRSSKAARHCTHLFDIAMLGLDHLRLDVPGRDYRMSVDGPLERECITLAIDGRRARTWKLSRNRFVSPAAWRGHDVGEVPALVSAEGDPLAFLEQMLMRRAVQISHGRFIDQDRWATAADLGTAPTCISFQHDVRGSARRVKGSARDFTGRDDGLLADL